MSLSVHQDSLVLWHRGTYVRDKDFQILKIAQETLCLFRVRTFTAARQEALATSIFSFCLVARPLFITRHQSGIWLLITRANAPDEELFLRLLEMKK